MAVRKMTFEPLAAQFLGRVASRDRSRFVSEALAARPNERDQQLIRACEAANQDLDVPKSRKTLTESLLSVSVYSNLHFSVVFRGNGAKKRA